MKTKASILSQGPGKWQEIVNEQGTSNLSVSAYCRQQGINEKTFYNWRKKFSNPPRLNNFIQIRQESKASVNVLKIQTPGGYSLEVGSGAEISYVQSILEVVKGLR
jgi:hypothetical protein